MNPCMPASRWHRLLKLKRKKKLFQDYHWLLFHPTTILSNKGRHFVCLLLAKNYQMHSKKSLQESTNRASERVLFPTSYLQLALAHARNSRVKNGKRYVKSMEWLRTDQFKKNKGFIFQEKPLMSPLNILTCLKFNESKI